MKRLEWLGPAAVLLLRALAVPPARWPADWVVVFGILWAALIASDRSPALRAPAVGAAAVWLLAIYAFHQGPYLLAWRFP
jgi:hypothetical protein